MTMATVSINLRTDKIKKDGTAPVHFLIIKNRKKTKISSGLSVNPKYWDYKNNRVKPGQKSSGRINSLLRNKLAEIQDQVLELETASRIMTARGLKDKIFGKAPVDFFPFADEVVEKYKAAGSIGTWIKNKSIINKLKEYFPTLQLTFHDIDTQFLAKYENYLRTDLSNKTNTISKDFKFIRKLFNDAYKQDLIEHQLNPFLKYPIKSEKSERHYLSEDELLKFENAKTIPGTKTDLVKDMFVFAAYSGGIRISDILLLQWKHFDGKNVNLTIQKTGTQLSVRIPDKGLGILKKYKKRKNSTDAFVFPMLPSDLDLKSNIAINRAITNAIGCTNKILKDIAKDVKIKRTLTFHISRHTWATRALRKGISIDKVSKLMGHSQIRETQIYAKIVSADLDKAMEVFNS